MTVYRRGGKDGVFWFDFWFEGQRYRHSTDLRNEREAKRAEETFRDKLIEGSRRRRERAVELGCQPEQLVRCAECEKHFHTDKAITENPKTLFCSEHCHETWKKKQVEAPTLRVFKDRFADAIKVRCANKPATVRFYLEKLARLLEFEPLASARLNRIDVAMIESYVQYRSKRVSPSSVNRDLATLRRLLHLAQEWGVINRVPRIRLLPGEGRRDFTLSHEHELAYLKGCPQPLRDIALLILDTGLRVGEAVNLEWGDVHAEPVNGAKFGYVHIREGKSRNAKRNVSLTARASNMLKARASVLRTPWVFPGNGGSRPFLVTSLDHMHAQVRESLNLPKGFVIHSLRHTALSRLGEAGAGAFEIMKIAGHSSVTISQRYVHPSPEAIERAFERLESYNAQAAKKAAKRKRQRRQGISRRGRAKPVPTKVPTPSWLESRMVH
jgi:integrase